MLFKKECIFLTVSRQNQEGTNSFQSLEDRKKIHEAKITLYRVCHVLSKKKIGFKPPMHQSYLHKSQQITEFSIIALNICSHFVEGRDAIKTVVLTSTLG